MIDLKEILSKQEVLFNHEALACYIPSQVVRHYNATPEDAYQRILEWLEGNKSTLLLLGDSGAGKTLFNQWLTQQLFLKQYSRLPLFIPLLAQSRPEDDLLWDYCQKTLRLSNEQIEWLLHQPLLLILDGVDELHKKTNLYRSNKLWQYNAKVLISCRSQALANVEDDTVLFAPCNKEQELQRTQLDRWTIAPFSQTQIDAYLSQYIQQNKAIIETCMKGHPDSSNWLELETYQTALNRLFMLKTFITSPFVLYLVAKTLPDIMQETNPKLAQLDLYQRFTDSWFKRQRIKLLEAHHIQDTTPIFEAYQNYSQKLAEGMLQHQVTSVTSQPNQPDVNNNNNNNNNNNDPPEDNPFAWFFEEKDIEFPSKEKIKLSYIRAGVPLMEIGQHHYAFLHKSLLEYFAARRLFEGAMMEASLALGLGLNDTLLIDEDKTLEFTVDKLKDSEALQTTFFNILEDSKYDHRLEIAAANAITALHRAHVSLAGRDFRGIRIRKANLSGAILDYCDFREADLREVNFTAASLNHVQFSGALMQSIQLGQAPMIQVDEEVNAIAYAPKGEAILAVAGDTTIKLYRPNVPYPFKVLKGHKEHITTIAFSPNGLLLASGSEDNTLRLWDPQTGHQSICLWDSVRDPQADQAIRSLVGHTYDVTTLAFSPDGLLLASGSWDETIRLWDPKTSQVLRYLRGYLRKGMWNMVKTLAFSPDGLLLASGSNNLRLWDPKTGQALHSLVGHKDGVNALAFSPDGLLLASGSQDKTLRLWDPKTGQELRSLVGHKDGVNALVFSPDGLLLASGSRDQTLRLWDPKTGQELRSLVGHTHWVNTLAFSPDGLLLASGSWDKTLRLWDPKTDQAVRSLVRHTYDVNTLAFSHNGLLFASGGEDRAVCLWDPKTGQAIRSLVGHTYGVNALAFSPNGLLLASGSKDKTIRLWDPKTGQALHSLVGHRDWVNTLAFNPDGSLLASGSKDNTLRLWDPKTGQVIRILGGHTYDVTTLAFSPDGLLLASGSWDETIRLWDPKTGQMLCSLKGGMFCKFMTLAFSPNGLLLASGSQQDNTLRLWDPKTGQQLRSLAGHKGQVTTLAFSSDGLLLASGSQDKTLRLWDIKTGQCCSLLTFKSEIYSLNWHKEGFAIAIDRQIECGYINAQHQFICTWRTSDYLTTQSAQLGGAIGLSYRQGKKGKENIVQTPQYQVLTQEGAEGSPSLKKMESVLADRNAPRPYFADRPHPSLISPDNLLSPDVAVVSMVKKKHNFHVFLLIETVENNVCIIRQADFFLDQKQPAFKIGLFAKGQALIEMVQKPEFEIRQLLYGYPIEVYYPRHGVEFKQQLGAWKKGMQDKKEEGILFIFHPEHKNWQAYLLKNQREEVKDIVPVSPFGQALSTVNVHTLASYDKNHLYALLESTPLFDQLTPEIFSKRAGCQAKSWGIDIEQAQKLINLIAVEQNQHKRYANAFNEAFKAESCLTWCEKMLRAIDIDLSEQQHWYDVIVTVPAWHFNEGVSSSEVTSSSDSSCSLM